MNVVPIRWRYVVRDCVDCGKPEAFRSDVPAASPDFKRPRCEDCATISTCFLGQTDPDPAEVEGIRELWRRHKWSRDVFFFERAMMRPGPKARGICVECRHPVLEGDSILRVGPDKQGFKHRGACP